MPRIVREAIVPCTSAEMYRLVRDVEAYPRFLPWCREAALREESETHQVATLAVAKSAVASTFTTRNRLEPEREIRMSLVDGPFHRLDGVWRFSEADEGGSRAELEVDFELGNRLVARVVGGAFTRVCDTLVAAFVRRAAALYGPAAAR